MKRVKSAVILQTLVFSQKPDLGYDKATAYELNSREYENYKQGLDKTKTRYRIDSEATQDDGSVIVHIRKQYNDKADVEEYFN